MGGLWAAVFVQVKETRGSGGGGSRQRYAWFFDLPSYSCEYTFFLPVALTKAKTIKGLFFSVKCV